ncbi:26294_t:CDS:2, partial [Gigaspora margarita]
NMKSYQAPAVDATGRLVPCATAPHNPPPIVPQASYNRPLDPQQPLRRRKNAAEILADFQRQQQEFINQNRDEFMNIDEDENEDIE